jgi:hypothetical protein
LAENVNLDRIGGIQQSGTDVIDTTNHAIKVNVVAGSAAGGDASGANQVTGNNSLASIDGKITAVNTGAVVVSSSALPSGAATGTKQDTGNTSLASIDGKITAVNTGAVVISSSALPSGAATALRQDTGNTSLANIDGHVDVALSTRLKPSDTLAGVTTVAAVTAITNALPVGSAVIGKVGIDQTTPGTTNGVQVNAALPAGTNVIGHVIADTGSTTAVTGTVAVQGSVAPGVADSANPLTIAANDGMGLVDTLDCELVDGQTKLLVRNPDVVRLLEQLLQEQRICNVLLVKLSEPYASSGWPSVTDPKTGVIQ